MAKVEGPLFSMAASGSFGKAVTFMPREGGTVARKYATPANPQSGRQMAVRTTMTTLSQAWAGLTQVQRTAWQNYAGDHQRKDPITGRPAGLNGFNFFGALNALAIDAGGTMAANPPAVPAPAPPSSIELSLATGDVVLAYQPALVANTKLDVWLAVMTSAGRQPQPNDFRHHDYVSTASPYTVVASAPAGIYYVHARIVSVTNGLYSGWLVDSLVVEALP